MVILRHFAFPWLLMLALFFTGTAVAQGSYQTHEAFIAEAFSGQPPPAKQLWLSGAAGEGYRAIMEEAPRRLRLHYWSEAAKDVWILEAIGKEQPITAGFVVENGAITTARVLVFRESRGWEIRHPFFTRQFSGPWSAAISRPMTMASVMRVLPARGAPTAQATRMRSMRARSSSGRGALFCAW